MRRCKDLQAAHPDSPWAGAVQAVLRDGLALRDRSNAGEISEHGLASARGRLAARLGRLIDTAPPLAAAERFAKHLANEFPAVFLFLCDPSIDATNWRAEQAIRPAVVTRKVCGGNRTRRGADTQQVLASVVRTARQRHLDPRRTDHDDAVRPRTRRARSSCAAATLLTGQARPLRAPVRTHSSHAEPAATARARYTWVSSPNRRKRPQDARRNSQRRFRPRPVCGAATEEDPRGLAPHGGADAPAGPACRARQPGRLTVPKRQNQPAPIDNLRKAQPCAAVTLPTARSISVPFPLAKTDLAPGNPMLPELPRRPGPELQRRARLGDAPASGATGGGWASPLRGRSVRMPRRACVPRSLPNPRSPHASPAPGPVARKCSGKGATGDPDPVDRWTLGPSSCERGRGTLVLDAPEVSGGPATVAA